MQNGNVDRAIKIGSIIVGVTLAFGAIQAQVADLQKSKVESERFVLDSASTANRLGNIEQVLTTEVRRLQANVRALCRKQNADCQ